MEVDVLPRLALINADCVGIRMVGRAVNDVIGSN